MTRTERKPVKYALALLNHPIYQNPDGTHTYATTRNARDQEVLHIPHCPLLNEVEVERTWEGTYQKALDSRMDICWRCQPHGVHHVTLPDGTRRYRPMGVIFTGGDMDGYEYGEYALVEKKNGRWRVHVWAESAPAAVKLAVELSVPYILGPPYVSLGLPTPIREEDLK